jgi:hypothetical protein
LKNLVKKRYEVEVNLIEKYNALSKTFSPTSNINDISFYNNGRIYERI